VFYLVRKLQKFMENSYSLEIKIPIAITFSHNYLHVKKNKIEIFPKGKATILCIMNSSNLLYLYNDRILYTLGYEDLRTLKIK